ncbi:hypothetical protein [Dokdonella soli]|uniref:SGNH/GDSL hydrolase family protein n=1 Tax=Dokdonella soli TaxID=529810 RepID=A0ABN1IHE5_9GAMM
MRGFLLKLLAASALIVMAEAAFQAGIWEPLAKPDSHAGTSVRLKRALTDPTVRRIDYVTLGSSRPEYGIDHALLAATAQQSGHVHADLTMPGSHWMTIGILTRWLQREHPEVRGGIVALSIADLAYPGNGNYELGIVYPFRDIGDIPWIAQHVPFERSDVESYGAYSALFGWRQDVRDFIAAPRQRRVSLNWFAQLPTSTMLFSNPESHGDMCAFGLDRLSACDRVDASTDPQHDGLKRQCKELRGMASGRSDFRLSQQPLSVSMQKTRDIVQAQLRATQWPEPPLVVLMPVPGIWTRDVLGIGLHDWALAILQPLADEGRIHLVDATGFFDRDGDAGCSAFFDFYHQNAEGRERFTRWLLPQVESMLYANPGSSGSRLSTTASQASNHLPTPARN